MRLYSKVCRFLPIAVALALFVAVFSPLAGASTAGASPSHRRPPTTTPTTLRATTPATPTTLAPALAAAAPATVTLAGPQVGLVTDLTWGTSRSDMDRTVTQIVASGAQWVRANVNWKDVEPVAGQMNPWWLSTIDYAVAQLSAHGVKVLMPVADGVPYWASADPARYTDGSGVQHWNQYWHAANAADYAAFIKVVVARYAPKGVHAYEIWNEPNYVHFWPSGPNPADYATLLKAAYPAVKAADPTATVVMGGLSLNDYSFVSGLYAAGAGRSFDAAAVHPYTDATNPATCWTDASGRNAASAFCGIQSVHNVMAANGDASKPIWLTEMGWSTCSCPGGVSETTAASYLSTALQALASYPYVARAFVYNLRNDFWLNNAPSNIEANYGLLRIDFSVKPGFAAFQSYALSHR